MLVSIFFILDLYDFYPIYIIIPSFEKSCLHIFLKFLSFIHMTDLHMIKLHMTKSLLFMLSIFSSRLINS